MLIDAIGTTAWRPASGSISTVVGTRTRLAGRVGAVLVAVIRKLAAAELVGLKRTCLTAPPLSCSPRPLGGHEELLVGCAEVVERPFGIAPER
jgi:hypothetical protein